MILNLVSISCVFLNGISAFWFNNGPTTEVPSNTSTPIRLVGGWFPWEGRVEIEHNGQWGTICDDMFDINDTKVVCRMLGYNDTDGSIEYYSRAYFGRGYGPILIDDLDCSGEEDDVSECNSTAWFTKKCYHGEDVSVNCAADYLIVRLVNGNYPWEGRVELLTLNGSWGTICDGMFGVEEAQVICGMLGYSKAGSVPYSGARFGGGDGPIVLNDLECIGTEASILDCESSDIFEHYCEHKDDAGVACQGNSSEQTTMDWSTSVDMTSFTNAPVRLVGGYYNWEGRVEVYHGGQWGTICDDQFDREDAQVICSMLGYSRYGSITSYSNAIFGEGSGSIMLDNLECSGYESDIVQCKSNGWYTNDCTHSEVASISCAYPKSYYESSTYQYNMTTSDTLGGYGHISIRLTAGNRGSLMLYYNGRWGYVCYNSNQYAYQFNSVCRSLGYSSANSISQYYESRPAIVTDFYCPGYHYSNGVDDCTGRNFGNNTYCNYKLYIECDSLTTEESVTKPLYSVETSASYTNVRLVGGNYYWEGRVEIYHNGAWGTICDDDFDTNEAEVICAMLGYNRYGSVTAYGNAAFGGGYGPIMLDNLNCNGYESDISQCSSHGWNRHNCGHNEDASVSCRYPKSGGRNEVTTVQYFERATTADVLGRHGHLSFRLTNGRYGLLEIYYKGRWGYVCHSYNQQRDEFHSTCRYLGYSSAYRVYGQYDSSHYAIVTDLHCPTSYYYNSYNGIDDCTGSRLGYTNYCGEKLYIECDSEASTVGYEVTTADVLGTHGHIPLRLTHGSHGYLEIYYNGHWGYVCHNSSQSSYQFNSVCRILGYSSAYKVYGAYNSVHTALVTELQCPRSYYYYSSSNGIDDCTGERLGYTTYCNDKLYIECDSVTTEETATVPFKTESANAKHITVNCQHSSWYVKVHLPPMEQQYSDFKETDIYLGIHSCTGTKIGDYLIFHEDYTTCGTYKIASANGFIYTNTLVYALHDPNQPYIVHEYRFRVSVECDMSKGESGENNTNIIHGNLEQQTISGVRRFDVQLKFFSDSNFQHEFNGFPPSYMVGQNVYVKATTLIHDYNVKMRLSDCYTKPSKSASDSYIYYLIQNGCPAAPSAFVTTKSTHETRFHFQDFEYAFHPDSMYVHCNATFCHTNDYSRDCEPRCSNRKRVGSIDQDDEPIEGVGPIGNAEDEATVFFQKGSEALNAGKKPEVENKGNKPLYVVGVVVVAVAMVAILVVTSIYFRSKRRQNGQSKIV